MNIKVQGFNLTSNYGLKSTQDRLDRQNKRDTKVAFFEVQKEKLKEMKAETLEENLSEMVAEAELVPDGEGVKVLDAGMVIEDDGNLPHYKRIDILI